MGSLELSQAALHQNFTEMKSDAEKSILERRSDSVSWIRMMNLAPWILGPRKGRLLQIVNTGMRYLDDIADGDTNPPEGYTRREYILEKQAVIFDPENLPKNPDKLDRLFQYGYQKAKKLHLEEDVFQTLRHFIPYLLFDEERLRLDEDSRPIQVFSQAELDYAYDECDIEGTVRGSLILFGENPERTPLLSPLARATRNYYTLRDYQEDAGRGLINVSQEAMATYGITNEDLVDPHSQALRAWAERQAKEGLELLDLHDEIMDVEQFKFIGELLLPVAYVNKARPYFKGYLAHEIALFPKPPEQMLVAA